ncbi:hypothetical protein OAF09_00215 [bacterium]|nr:hypothetical protein [bacterium]
MPLRKIWNSLCGRSSTESKAVEPAGVKLSQADKKSVASTRSRADKRARSGQKLSSEDADLLQRIIERQPKSILEIGIGNGNRSVALLGSLSDAGLQPRYYAVDQFELGGGDLTLRDFHQALRAIDIRPQLFPESIQVGLKRFLHTIGTAECILFTESRPIEQEAEVDELLQRIANPTSLVLKKSDNHWFDISRVDEPQRRAA